MAKYEIKDGVGIIPERTKVIKEEAFKYCNELTSIIIPASVTEIRGWANKVQYNFRVCVMSIKHYACRT